jgi:hypothetical protein
MKESSPTLQETIEQSPFVLHPLRYAVLQVAECPNPQPHFLVTHETEEISVITTEDKLEMLAPQILEQQLWFRLLEFKMSTPFETPGFLAAIASKLASRQLNILLVSTFSKDWLLLREDDLKAGLSSLHELGFQQVFS